jgi:integrase
MRLKWSDINLERAKVTISDEAAKKGKRRVNDIPDNAVEWLKLCKPDSIKDGTKVAPKDCHQRLKRLRNKAKITYPQNAMRHSFASYHLALNQNSTKTAILLGHPNPALLYSNYNELVTPEMAKLFFDIVPAIVKKARHEADLAAKTAAEKASHWGMAEKVNGVWQPMKKEIVVNIKHGYELLKINKI